MDRDRSFISHIIAETFNNPDPIGSPSTLAIDQLERYIEHTRAMVLGGTVAWACSELDSGKDPRQAELPEVWLRCEHDLSVPVERRCCVCGCTDLNCNGCIDRTGEPCTWIEEDLCSACVAVLQQYPRLVPDSPEEVHALTRQRILNAGMTIDPNVEDAMREALALPPLPH